MIQNEGSKKTEYPVRELAKIWSGITPLARIDGTYDYGSRRFTQMVEFLQHALLTSEHYEFYKALTPARTLEETYEEYKVRQKFQHALSKYKFTVKQAVFINTVEMLQEKAKENGTKN